MLLVPRKRGSIFSSITSLLFSPLTFVTGIFTSLLSVFLPFGYRRGGLLSMLLFLGKILAVTVFAAVLVDQSYFSNWDASSKMLLGGFCVFSATAALCATVYGLFRSFVVAGFWVAAIMFLSQNFLSGQQADNSYAKQEIFPKKLPGGLVYEDISNMDRGFFPASFFPDSTVKPKRRERAVQASSPGIQSTVLNLLNPTSILDQPLNYFSELMGSSTWQSADSRIFEFSSGVLPSSAYFPPVSKRSNFYPVGGSSTGEATGGLLNLAWLSK